MSKDAGFAILGLKLSRAPEALKVPLHPGCLVGGWEVLEGWVETGFFCVDMAVRELTL